MSYFLAPDPVNSTYFIPGGNTPANGGQVFFYLAGTSTKTTVYKDNAGGTSWTNPIVLDSGGNLPSGGVVWFAAGAVIDVVFAPSTDSDPPVSPYWRKEDLVGINDTSVTVDQWIAGTAPTYVSAISFTVAGDQTTIYQIGRRVRTTNTGGTIYSTVAAASYGAGITTVIVRNDSGALDAGLSAISYGILSASNGSEPTTVDPPRPPQARITLKEGTPVPAMNVVSSRLFLTPYRGSEVDIYNTTAAQWLRYKLVETSMAVPASSVVWDVFAKDVDGTVGMEMNAWLNNTTRNLALTTVAGIPVLSSSLDRLYMGTVWVTSGVIADTASTRGLWNYWNQETRPMAKTASTASITYPLASSGIPSVFGGDSSNALTAVFGDASASLLVQLQAVGRNSVVTSNAQLIAAVGVDSFNNLSTGTMFGRSDTGATDLFGNLTAVYSGLPGLGLHTFAWVQQFSGFTSCVWLGSSAAGMSAEFRG